ncbi:MAG TPA: hypothetical protein VMT99_01145 [Candidatus Paceibacterota bacterium]|nr:hypothetical protein [Candidatus Paceibacterota bacterium]
MKLTDVLPSYRASSNREAPIEDAHFSNEPARLFGVFDGVSEAYSPAHPFSWYFGELTGGQMAANVFRTRGSSQLPSVDVERFLLEANEEILARHRQHHKDPLLGDDVGGGAFAVCRLGKERITFVVGADCFAFYKLNGRFHFITNFDEAAYEVEDRNNRFFAECLERAAGSKAVAFDLFWERYRLKRISTANKNKGTGGFATLNGDPNVRNLWTVETIDAEPCPEAILLGTDGCLASTLTDPRHRPEFIATFSEVYGRGGINGIRAWRDVVESAERHVTARHEGTALELKLEP